MLSAHHTTITTILPVLKGCSLTWAFLQALTCVIGLFYVGRLKKHLSQPTAASFQDSVMTCSFWISFVLTTAMCMFLWHLQEVGLSCILMLVEPVFALFFCCLLSKKLYPMLIRIVLSCLPLSNYPLSFLNWTAGSLHQWLLLSYNTLSKYDKTAYKWIWKTKWWTKIFLADSTSS